MYYFLLQKLSPLTQRWRLVEVAFDPTYDYLYYSAPLERTDIAHYACYHERCDEDEHDARLPPRSPELRVRWRHKLKLTALHYAADDYAVPASSQDFKEAILLTFTVDGVERRLPSPQTATAHKATQSSTTVSGFGTSVQSLTSTADLKARQTTRQHASTRSRRKSTITTMRSGVAAVETARSSTSTSLQHLHSASYSQCESGSFGSPDLLRSPGAGAKNIRNTNSRGEEDDENDNDAVAHAAALTVATPEYPSLRLDVHTIHLSADGPAADLEDEVENVFRVNDLAPSSSSSSSEEESDDEDEEEEATSEEEEAEGTDSTTTTATENESDAEDAADDAATASRRDRDGAEVTSRRSSHVARRAGRDSRRHHDNQHYHSGGNNGRETEGNEAMTAVAAPRRENDNDDEDSAGGSTEESLAHRFTFGLFGRKVNKPRSLTFRALSYEAFRIVSLRLRQALVRHGYCAPLHAGLPLYDPRNGIALATVPLHLRYIFRRLNDVVFYSLQCGHTVYVRHYREVRGFYGYLCITHDTVLLLQEDGRCPRWLDLADITGVDYVLQGKNSFVAIRAAAPCADFVFIPVFPAYPYCVDFDAEETVEGIVSMLRRLLRQRLRLHEDVSLPPPSTTSPRRRPQDRSVTTQCDEGSGNNDESDDEDDDSDGDDDRLCHIADCSRLYGDVFRYIAARGAERFMLSRGMCGKAPQHFTYKRDLVAALRRGDDDEDDNREDDDDDDVQREGGAVQVSRAGRGQAGSAGDIRHRRENLQRSQEPHSRLLVHAHGEAILPAVGQRRGEDDATRARGGGAMPLSGELASQASFTTMTVSHLLAPPSHAAELRARDRLRLTRTDPQQRRRRRQEQQHGDKEEEHYTHEVDGDNSRECDRRVALASATRRVAATASETRHRDPGHLTQARPDSSSHSVPSLHGSGVVMGVVVAGGAGQRPVKAPTCVVTPAEDVFTDSKHGSGHVISGAQGGTRQAAAAVSRGSEVNAISAGTIAAPVATAPHREAASATAGTALATRLPSPGSPTGLGSTRSKRNSYGLVPVTSPVGGAAPGSLGGSGDSRSGGAHNETNAKIAVTTVMVVPANKGARLPLQTAATTTTTAAATTQGTAAKAAAAHPDKLVITSSEDEDEEEEDDDSFDSEDVNDLLETAH